MAENEADSRFTTGEINKVVNALIASSLEIWPDDSGYDKIIEILKKRSPEGWQQLMIDSKKIPAKKIYYICANCFCGTGSVTASKNIQSKRDSCPHCSSKTIQVPVKINRALPNVPKIETTVNVNVANGTYSLEGAGDMRQPSPSALQRGISVAELGDSTLLMTGEISRTRPRELPILNILAGRCPYHTVGFLTAETVVGEDGKTRKTEPYELNIKHVSVRDWFVPASDDSQYVGPVPDDSILTGMRVNELGRRYPVFDIRDAVYTQGRNRLLRLNFEKYIGRGQYGVVYRVNIAGQIYAIKVGKFVPGYIGLDVDAEMKAGSGKINSAVILTRQNSGGHSQLELETEFLISQRMDAGETGEESGLVLHRFMFFLVHTGNYSDIPSIFNNVSHPKHYSKDDYDANLEALSMKGENCKYGCIVLPCLVMRMMHTSLRDISSDLTNLRRAPMLRFIRNMGSKLAKTLLKMHSRDTYHNDIKSENVLFDQAFPTHESARVEFGKHAYLCDFSLSSMTRTINYTIASPIYKSPECWMRTGAYDVSKSDLWALGILLYEALRPSDLPFPTNGLVADEYDEFTIIKNFMGRIIETFGQIPECSPFYGSVAAEFNRMYAKTTRNFENAKMDLLRTFRTPAGIAKNETAKQAYARILPQKPGREILEHLATCINSENYFDMINGLLKINPNERFDASDVLNHEFIKIDYVVVDGAIVPDPSKE